MNIYSAYKFTNLINQNNNDSCKVSEINKQKFVAKLLK